MKVILLSDVSKVCKNGEIVEVADGYARNYLIARRLAVQATQKSLEILDEQKVQQKLNEKEMESQARQTVEKLKAREFLSRADQFLLSAKDVKGLKVVTMSLKDISADDMRKMGDFLRDKEPRVAALLAAVNDGKITFLATCGKEAVAHGVKAWDIIKAIAPICGGKGGGKPDSAMGGGSDLLKLDDALAAVDNFVAEKLGV